MAAGRNQPCPCGSGRRLKQCCIGTANHSQGALFKLEDVRSPDRHDHQYPAPMPGQKPDVQNDAHAADEPQAEDHSRALARVAHLLASLIAAQNKMSIPPWANRFLESKPESLLVFLEGFLETWPGGGNEKQRKLTEAYYLLLGIEMMLLRISLDRHYGWAEELRDCFKREVAGAIRDGRASTDHIVAITGLMAREEIPLGDELVELCSGHMEHQAEASEDFDPSAACADIAEKCNHDPFLVQESFFASGGFSAAALTADFFQVLLSAPQPAIKEGAALEVLDPAPGTRKAAAEALGRTSGAITPSTLRRLIAIRRWLAEAERPPIDRVIRAARLAGVECAQWTPAAAKVELYASAPDGAGAQTAIAIAGNKNAHRLFALLFKLDTGVSSVLTSDPQSLAEIKQMLQEHAHGIYLVQVSQTYLDEMVGYYLRRNLEHATPPPAQLLAVAEVLQASHWQPAQPGWREMLPELMAEVRGDLLTPNSVRSILKTSEKWAMRNRWADSWVEEGQELEELLDNLSGRSKTVIRDTVINQVIEKRRDIWTERFTLTARLMKEAPGRTGLPWEHFAILAQKMTEDVPLRELPVMRRVAEISAYM